VIALLGSSRRRITVHPVVGKHRTHLFRAALVDRQTDGSERLTPVRIKVTGELTSALPNGLLLCSTTDGAVAIGNLDPIRWGRLRGNVLTLLRNHLSWTEDSVEFVIPGIVPYNGIS
jgi:hypothetical protein